VLAGGTRSYDFRADLRAVYQYYCQNHPKPDEPAYPLWQGQPVGSTLTNKQLDERLEACTGVNLPKAQRTPAQQRNLDNILAVIHIPERTLDSHLGWATFTFADMVNKRLDGHNPFSNVGVVYAGSDDDAALNKGVARFAADPEGVRRLAFDADLSGKLTVPTLTMHAIDDPTAFVELEQVFHDTVAKAGASDLLVQSFTDEHEHSKLATPEYAALLRAMSAWIERGEKPSPASLATAARRRSRPMARPATSRSITRPAARLSASAAIREMSGQSAVAAVMDGVGPVSALAAEMATLEAAMVDPDRADEMDAILERYGEVLERFQELDGYALDARAREVLAGLSFSQERMDGDVGLLSGGWKMRVALARILLMRPDGMLLDEPSNHLDLESLIWLEAFLKDYDGALLMTSHDRAFMNRIIGKVVEIDAGSLITYSGDLDFYDQQRALGEQQRQAQYERQQAMLAKEIKFIEKFKARASHAAQVQSRVKKLDKIERVEAPRRRQSVQFDFQSPPRSGDDVINLRDVHKGYGAQPIYEGLDFLVRRKERWCVLGANGAGKSTLLKLVAGDTKPDQGTVNIGASVRMGYFAQHSMDLLDGEETIFESLERSFPQAGQGALRTLAGCFGFSGDDVEKPCRVLSGGEKARLVMAKMLFDPPNLLVLDEPTNHLDMATKEMLVAALADFEGTMLFVSHDRHFLAALSNRVLELTPEGVHQYGGGYTEYVTRTGQEAPGLHPGG
jgi:ATPase subunit of ABC transporter with duplicated ATPase domains